MNWKSPKGKERLFPWLQVLESIEKEDAQISHHSQKFAHQLLGGCDCPGCGKRAGRLRWVCLDRDRQVGWLTVCTRCQEQVEFLIDEELTQLKREENS